MANRRTTEQHGDEGDTLLEILIAMVVISITVVSVMGAFSTAISASVRHQSLAKINALLRSYAENATFQIQLQPSPLYTPCASAYSPTNLPTVPTGYAVTVSSIKYWNGTSFATTCTAGSKAPQLVTISGTGPYNQTGKLSFAVASFGYSATKASPSITSVSSFTATAGTAFSFTITTTGSPPPAITKTGTLPSGVTLTDNLNGTATLSGTSAVAGGTTALTINAINSVSPNASQSFTLTVSTPPVITSVNHVTWTHGTKVSFTVTATGIPTPGITYSGTLPPNVTFPGGTGTATIGTGAGTLTSATGVYVFTIIANSGAINTVQTFTITVV